MIYFDPARVEVIKSVIDDVGVPGWWLWNHLLNHHSGKWLTYRQSMNACAEILETKKDRRKSVFYKLVRAGYVEAEGIPGTRIGFGQRKGEAVKRYKVAWPEDLPFLTEIEEEDPPLTRNEKKDAARAWFDAGLEDPNEIAGLVARGEEPPEEPESEPGVVAEQSPDIKSGVNPLVTLYSLNGDEVMKHSRARKISYEEAVRQLAQKKQEATRSTNREFQIAFRILREEGGDANFEEALMLLESKDMDITGSQEYAEGDQNGD